MSWLLALVAVILWLNERSGGKLRAEQEYRRGRSEERLALEARLKAVLSKDTVGSAKVRRAVFGDGEVTAPPPLPGSVPVAAAQLDVPDLTDHVAAELAAPATPEEIEAEKERRTVANLNKLLYIGSFMIVAAAALFVNLTMPPNIKLIALTLVTGAFYAAGLVLHARSSKLRPAAVAFAGTGLAILPFIGLALPSLGGWSNEAAWLATSAVGLLAYSVAAVRLKSQPVSYVTMAFVLSLSLSAVSTLGLGLMWYFIALIGVSLLINSVAYLAPKLLPEIFARPLKDTGQVVAPITLLASLFVYERADLFMYEVLFSVTTLHYAVIWLQTRRVAYEQAVRVLAHVTALIFFYDISAGTGGEAGIITFGFLWIAVAALQVVYSCIRVRAERRSTGRESIWFGAMLALMIAMLPLWLAVEESARWLAAHIAVIGLLQSGVALRLRQAEWGYAGLAASVLVPVIVARFVVEPAIPEWILALFFLAIGAITLAVLDSLKSSGKSEPVLMLVSSAVVSYAATAAALGLVSGDSLTLGWAMAGAAALLVLYSYVMAAVAAEVVGALLAVLSIRGWVDNAVDSFAWQWLVFISLSALLMLIAAVLHHVRGERGRRNAVAIIGASVFAGMVLTAAEQNLPAIRTATLLLIAAGIGMLALRIFLSARASTMGYVALAGYTGYPLLALLAATALGGGWAVLPVMVLAGAAWVASYIERQPGVLALGNILLIAGLYSLWAWLEFNPDWQTYGVAWLAAGVFYLTYWFSRDRRDAPRQAVSLWSLVAVLGLAALWGIFTIEPKFVIASAGSLIAASAVVALHGYLEGRKDYIEGALYAATFGLQRVVEVLLPAATMVVYGHWWGLVIGLMALWRKDSRWRLGAALAFITLPAGLQALSGTGGDQLFFLIEHTLIAVAGALGRKQWVMWWGIAAVIAATLYFLRSYAYAALLFIGVLLIVFVIWRLLKSGRKNGS